MMVKSQIGTSRMSVEEYPLPKQADLEGMGYCVFPAALENDDLVLFHATAKENMTSIMREGFKSGATLGTSTLTSVSFSYKSSGALHHAMGIEGDRVIFAVRYETLDGSNITRNPSDIYDFTTDPAPVVIGFCNVPAGYRMT